MNGRNYVPFKTKKSSSIVSTTDSLLSELSCSTQVIGQVNSSSTPNGQITGKKLSSSTQKLTDNSRTLSQTKLNGSSTFNKQSINKSNTSSSVNRHHLLKKRPFSTSMSSVNNLNRNWCSMTSLASHQSERTNCTYLLRPSNQLPNTPLNKIDLINAIPQTTTTRFYLNYSVPTRSVLTSDNELVDCPVHFSHRCNPFTCYHHQMYINSLENDKSSNDKSLNDKSLNDSCSTLTINNLSTPSTTSDLNSTSNSDVNHSNLDDVGAYCIFYLRILFYSVILKLILKLNLNLD